MDSLSSIAPATPASLEEAAMGAAPMVPKAAAAAAATPALLQYLLGPELAGDAAQRLLSRFSPEFIQEHPQLAQAIVAAAGFGGAYLSKTPWGLLGLGVADLGLRGLDALLPPGGGEDPRLRALKALQEEQAMRSLSGNMQRYSESYQDPWDVPYLNIPNKSPTYTPQFRLQEEQNFKPSGLSPAIRDAASNLTSDKLFRSLAESPSSLDFSSLGGSLRGPKY